MMRQDPTTPDEHSAGQVVAPSPPPTRADDITDEIHGVCVSDPYRWLEDDDDPEVQAWVRAQNNHTQKVISSLRARPRLHERLTELLRAGSSVMCKVAADRVFSLERWGHHDQAALVVRSSVGQGVARTVVDPSTLGNDPTLAIDWFEPSPDGRLVAYGLSSGGDELSTLHVLDVETGRRVDEAIPDTRAASIAWLADATAFAYTRFSDVPARDGADGSSQRNVYWHALGEDWLDDELIFGDLPDRTAWPNVTISPDGRWLIVHVSLGWSRIDVHMLDRRTGAWTTLIEGIDAISSFEIVGDQLIGITTLDADRGRVVSAPVVAAWHDNWCTLVPEGEAVMEALVATSASLVVLSNAVATARVDRYDMDGTNRREIPLPDIGSLAGFSGSRKSDSVFMSFTSFTTPPTMMRWSAERSGRVETWSHLDSSSAQALTPVHQPTPAADAEVGFEVEQVRYPSVDGTEIPMFLVHRAGLIHDPDTPCVLTGYGGFGLSMSPAYSAAVVEVCANGGIYAIANIRGGSEFGEAWHRAGMRENKQRSFDDFIAAADWLVDNGRTSRERLAIRGGSNGGLLMGAAIAQRPDLCRAAQIAVPLLDMVRYHLFLIGKLWIPEYGDPDVAEELAWLHRWSPYHAVEDGTCYPAVLLTSADGDSRVHPMHARKMTARLQAANSCAKRHPVLMREEPRAGHGQGKPVSAQADELADALAFLFWQIGLS